MNIQQQFSTLVDLLRYRAIHQAEQTVFTFLQNGEIEAGKLTYQELDRQARTIATSLQLVIVPGERALLLYPSEREFVAGFFGCLYAGVVAVPAYPPRRNQNLSRLQTIIGNANATVALTTKALLTKIEGQFAQNQELAELRWLATDDLASDLAEAWQELNASSDTLAFLQYSSGSTGTPKGVMVSHGNIMHNERLIQSAFRHTEQSIVVGWLPLFHDMGLIGNLVQPLYSGSHCILMSPMDFLQRPLQWLQAISRYKATTSGGPNFAYDLCVDRIDPDERLNLDLSSWEIAFNGAEPVRAQTLERFVTAFEPCGFRREAFYPCYGMAETTLIVSGGIKETLPVLQTIRGEALEQNQVVPANREEVAKQTLVSSGRSLQDLQIVIVHPETLTRCSPDEVGEIWIAGLSVTQGYWNRSEDTEQTFRIYLKDTGEGPFLRTGDLGFLKEGELFITGRLKDLIIIRGRNYYPQDIEWTVEQSSPALRPTCGTAFSIEAAGEERLVVVQEVKRSYLRKLDVDEVIGAVRQAVVENHQLQVYGVLLLKTGSIPKTSSGKLQRHACRTGFLDGSLNVVGSSILEDFYSSMESEARLTYEALLAIKPEDRQPLLESYLQKQVARVLKVALDQFDLQQSLSSLGLDSLMAIELKNDIETNLGVFLPMTSFLQNSSVAKLAKQVLEQLSAIDPPRSVLLSRVSEHCTVYPLSYAQQRLWLLDQLEPGNSAYNISTIVCFKGLLNLVALEQSFDEILRRHEALRTTFALVDGRPMQLIAPSLSLVMPVVDLSELFEDEEAESQHLAIKEAQQSFDLSEGPLLRVRLLKLAPEKHVLLLTVHHIISDGWSLGIFIQELSTLYRAFCAGEPSPLPELPIQYADFAVWQRQWLTGKILETQLNYWQQQLAGAPPLVQLPTDRPRPPVQTFQGAQHSVVLSKTLVTSLKTLSRSKGVTLFTILLAALKILLFQWTGQTDLVVGTVIAGRNRSETDRLIGCFINFLALRLKVSGDKTGQEFIKQVATTVLEAYAHQDCPFERVVEAINPERKLSRNPIYNVALLLQNFPFKTLFDESLDARLIPSETSTSLLDLRFVVYESSEKILLSCEYNTDLFNHSTIEHLVVSYRQILQDLVEQTLKPLSDFKLTDALKAQAKGARVREQQQTIAIAATFTAEPIEEFLAFWMKELSMPSKIEFASYNQVFQQLLNSSSQFAQNKSGINVVLVRLEDLQKYENKKQTVVKTAENFHKMIERNVQELLLALKSAAQRSAATPYLVCLCPYSPSTLRDAKRAELFEQMEKRISSELAVINSVYLVTTSELISTYPVTDYYDSHGDELGHIPYTPAFFSALGTIIARKIHAIKSNAYKVIVLDCDQTLWKGVCGEDGAAGVEIDPPRRFLQEFVVAQQEAGKLVCLCSKNNESDVWAVFEHHQSMPLRQQHLVSWRLNWRSKSENLKSLAEELQLGLDSFVFLEDNPVECAEVRGNCPEVLTLQLPQETSHIPQFIKHIWAFDNLEVTTEDRTRTELYRQNFQRERWRQKSLVFEDFIASLELQVEVSKLISHQLFRVAQLTQRTNQFNLTTIRRSEAEIQRLWQSRNLECLAVKVQDRFGDYGLVGAMLFKSNADDLTVDTFLLSCRVLGRGVEYQMLAWLGAIAKERGLSCVKILYVPTPKNQPALDFLDRVGEEYKQKTEQGWLFKFPANWAAQLTFKPKVEESLPESGLPAQSENWEFARPFSSNSALYERIATELCDAALVLKAIETQKQKARPEVAAEFVEPRTPTEEILAAIWAEVLGLDQVGVHDNFFELGGHSLLATQVVSRMRSAFSIELPLRSLFEAPTLDELAHTLDTASSETAELQAPAIEPVPREGELPLSFAQQRLWFLEQLEGERAAYNMPGALELSGSLNRAALEQVLSEIVRRHEVLRTCFESINGSPVQVIDPTPNLTLPMVDLQEVPEAEQSEEVRCLAREEAQQSFDLSEGPLLRVRLLKLAPEKHVLLLTVHHIISDGWSLGIFIQELSTLYRAFCAGEPSPLPELPIQYADFAVWQRQWLTGKILETQLNYWQQQLAGAPPLVQLPTDRPRPPVQTFRGGSQSFALSTELAQQLKSLSQHLGATLFMTLLSAFAVLLSRYSRQEDIVVGSPVANRTRQEIEPLIGFFVNTLALRINLENNPSFPELLGRVRQVALDAYAHQDVPFEKLVEELQPERNLSHSPLFQVMFVLQNAPMEELKLPGLSLTSVELKSNTAKFDLTLSLTETESGLQGYLEYNSDLFEATTITRMAGHFQTLLENIVAHPEQPIAQLPLLTEAEQHQLLVEWNDTQTEYPQDKCIHQLFEEQVEKTPEAVAVVFEDQQLTYAELNERANQLAHYLQSLGVGSEVLVGICVERSPEMVVGLLGILKAGGAYVPLDPAYPSERLTFMLEDTMISVLLTQKQFLDRLPAHEAQVICLDSDRERVKDKSNEDPASNVTVTNQAYVMYTSGSTGRPKGVSVIHQGIVRLVKEVSYVKLTSEEVFLQLAPISFDASTFEIWGCLLNGARLIIFPSRTPSLEDLGQAIQQYQITTLWLTAGLFHLMVDERIEELKSLRQLLAGGDILSVPHVQKVLQELVDCSLINGYGPTENTTFTCCYPIRELKQPCNSIPIGRPIANTQIYILDSYGQPVPVGVPGELHIGGAGLARGYLNRPELTQEKFIPNPFSDESGASLYKTGDLARYLPDGKIEFLGRIDNQVKIRGFRIELGEIETVLGSHPEIRETVVLAHEDEPGDKRLIAYIVVERDLENILSQLRSYLKQRLPDYMMPSAFVTIEAMPLTSNGKIDRRALPAPDLVSRQLETNFVAPRTPTEELLVGIWIEVLGIEQVGVHDNFFELGGHSLLATQVVSRARETFSVELPLRSLFSSHTVADVAQLIETLLWVSQESEESFDEAETDREVFQL